LKTDIRKKLHQIFYLVILPVYVPSRFLYSWVLAIWAFRLKPYPTTFQKFGIRVVAQEEDEGTWNDQIKVYAALELLSRHDKEKLGLVKKYIRIIMLSTIKNKGLLCFYMGAGVCLLDLKKLPVEMSSNRRAIKIIGWLVYEASKIKFKGKLGAYLSTSEEILNLCIEEQRRTVQKFCE